MYRLTIKHSIAVLFLVSSCFFHVIYSPFAWSQIIVSPAQQKKFSIANKKVSESSGLACSTRDKKLLWTHNDSGHMPIIYAMDDKGRDLGTFYLEGLESRDWEDMDAFEYHGKHYLLIADTGDNFRMRLDYQISVIKEPETGKTNRAAKSPVWSFAFKFEDGNSYDVESVAVDILREKIVLLTKRTPQTLMFELPLRPDEPEKIQIALNTGEFKEIVNPTALDISADGELMSINTYRRIHRFTRQKKPTAGPEKSVPENNWVYDDSISYKKLFQPEAMCLSLDKKHYYVSSEKKPYLLKIRAKNND